jgi:hypothetical protein
MAGFLRLALQDRARKVLDYACVTRIPDDEAPPRTVNP